MRLILALYVFAAMNFNLAQATEYQFQSNLDRFTVEITDSGAEYNGEQVRIEPFAFINPLFLSEVADTCEGVKGRPDLTITRNLSGKQSKRLVYIEQKIVSDGEHCGGVTGHGVFQLPLHRSWFDGKKRLSIALSNQFSIWKDDRTVVQFEKTKNGWQNQDPEFFANWKFFEQFVTTLQDFPVDFRLHPAAAKELSKFELRQGSRIFNFYKVGDSTWAVQFPDVPWLAASGSFGLFENMDQTVWISPFVKALKIVKDKSASNEKRLMAIRSVADNTSPDIREVFYSVIESEDDPIIKREIVGVLRKHPTNRNFKSLVAALKVAHDPRLQEEISKALRIRNPKGPVISLSDDDSTVTKKIADWELWGRTLK